MASKCLGYISTIKLLWCWNLGCKTSFKRTALRFENESTCTVWLCICRGRPDSIVSKQLYLLNTHYCSVSCDMCVSAYLSVGSAWSPATAICLCAWPAPMISTAWWTLWMPHTSAAGSPMMAFWWPPTAAAARLPTARPSWMESPTLHSAHPDCKPLSPCLTIMTTLDIQAPERTWTPLPQQASYRNTAMGWCQPCWTRTFPLCRPPPP